MRRWEAAALCAGWMLTSCASLRIVRTGANLPPRPAECGVRFEHLSLQQAMAQGEQEILPGITLMVLARGTPPPAAPK